MVGSETSHLWPNPLATYAVGLRVPAASIGEGCSHPLWRRGFGERAKGPVGGQPFSRRFFRGVRSPFCRRVLSAKQSRHLQHFLAQGLPPTTTGFVL
jgi:hypothetical protein